MKIRLAVVIFALEASGAASAQIHLITGSPSPKSTTGYTAGLFRLGGNGGIERVASLVGPDGVEWISVSPELRKAVLATKSRQEGDIVVVNFDKAAVVKRCTDPAGTGAVPWLLDIPGKGAVYAQQTGQALIHTMALDPAIPCDHRFAALDPVDAKYVVASGQGGVSGVGGADWMQVGLSKEGAIARTFAQGVLVYFDYQVPPSMLADLKERASMVIANNRRLFAVSAIDFDNPSSYRLLILRKSDNTWRRMPDVGESVDCERAFGEFIAEVAAIRRRSPAAGESAGRSD